MDKVVSAIVVTHNSAGMLKRCLKALQKQTFPLSELVVVDCDSTNRDYLAELRQASDTILVETENIGFARANNLALTHLAIKPDFLLFLNPDTFLPPDFIEKAVALADNHPEVGLFSGKLLGYDLEKDSPNGKLDSTGVFRKWYGRWYDRGQGEEDLGHYDSVEYIPALCGALLFCPFAIVDALGSIFFDPEFFLYKEDIDLSLRLRKKGWKLLYSPDLTAYHCRGWHKRRRVVSHDVRLLAARSEILLYKKNPSPYAFWAILKYCLVKFLRF
jgi:GT2 family glycosyltransferase